MEQRDFARAALEYVCLIQEVQERKKFEFVETVSAVSQSRDGRSDGDEIISAFLTPCVNKAVNKTSFDKTK